VRVALILLVLLVALAAFGGTYAATAIPLGLFAIGCAAVTRPALKRPLDTTLLSIAGAVAIQLVPLPSILAGVISPHWEKVRSALSLVPSTGFSIRPLSIRATDTEWALAVIAGALALFLFARASYASGGVRRTVRALVIVGFVMSCIAIAQAAASSRYILLLFPSPFAGPLPFGPFINRNHFATWIIMALPVAVGYLAAHMEMGGKKAPVAINPRARVQYLIDTRGAWLTAAAALMLIALLLSLSRSGALALVVSGMFTFLMAGRQLPRDRRLFLFGIAALLIVVTFGWAEIRAATNGVGGASSQLSGRLTVWRETLPLVRDFWLTGTGAGTYRTAMMLYQQSDRSVYFNQANSHYLQVLAEGGLLLAVPLVLGLRAFARAGYETLRRDHTPLFWIRAGAACGLGAVALQSLWETGLVMPANAFLAAVLAALLLHDDRSQLEDRRHNRR
jgi:O-antigen ligase